MTPADDYYAFDTYVSCKRFKIRFSYTTATDYPFT